MFHAMTYRHALAINADSHRYASHIEAFVAHEWAMDMYAMEANSMRGASCMPSVVGALNACEPIDIDITEEG